jgi:hypothetical protein
VSSWAAPTSVGTSPVSRYDIRDAASGLTQTAVATARSYTWTAVTTARVTLKVRAITSAGAGAWAQVTTQMTLTPTPSPTPTPTPTRSPTTSPTPTPTGIPAGARYVSPSGSDSAAGTQSTPYRSIKHALAQLRAGDTLVVRGGTYTENVSGVSVSAGTASARVMVRAYPGERPVLVGLLWLSAPSYWTLDGINVTWNPSNSSSQHMVKMSGGTGWRLTHAEIWGARSYAGILVAGSPSSFELDHLYVHDTYRSNATNQDHLVYINAGTGGGVLEHNIFAHSENGRGVKIGPPSSTDSSPIGNIVIRYNTFLDNDGPSNLQLSYTATDNRIYRNIFVKSGSGNSSVTAYNLSGSGNSAWDNMGWDCARVLDASSHLQDAGGNVKFDPQLSSSFTPQAAAAVGYGAFAQ